MLGANMKKTCICVATLLASLFFCVSFTCGSFAYGSTNRELSPAEEKCMYACQTYRAHEANAKVDIQEFLTEAKTTDPKMYNTWNEIFKFWFAMNENPNFVNINTANVPNNNTVCILILGCGILDDGTPTPEAIGRIDTAIKSWKTHPNTYIGVTGGKTNPNVSISEGESMFNYITSNYDISPDKIIVEKEAANTQQNIDKFYAILNNNKVYSSIDKICMATSDYHIRRACILWQGKVLATKYYPEVYGQGRYIPLIENTAYDTQYRTTETIGGQGIALERLLFDPKFSTKNQGICPSILQNITLNSEAKVYLGETFKPTVTGNFLRDDDLKEDVPFNLSEFIDVGDYIYNSQLNEKLYNFNQDVSNNIKVECDTTKVGKQACTISYSYNDVTKTINCEVEVVDPNIKPINPEEQAIPETSTDVSSTTGDWPYLNLLCIALVASCLISSVIIIRNCVTRL